MTTDAAKTAFNELATMVTEDKVTDLEGLTGGADMKVISSYMPDAT